MANQDYELFKQEVRGWLDNHIDEYDDFISEMSQKPLYAFEKIYKLGMTMTPQLMKKARVANHGDIVMDQSQFEEFAGSSELGKALVDEFHNLRPGSVLPCLLSWILFGRCYEMMAHHLTQECKSTKSYPERLVYSARKKFVVWGSIRNKARTKDDWQRWQAEQSGITSDDVFDLGFDEIVEMPKEEPTPILAASEAKALANYLIDEDGSMLERIKERLLVKHNGPSLAHLYYALQLEKKMANCDMVKFHRLMQQEVPNISLGTTRNFQIAVKKRGEVVGSKPLYMIGEDGIAVDAWRACIKGIDNE